MKIKRSIFVCLLCLSIALCGVSSSFAFSASESNALLMEDAKEFVPNFIPMKSTDASPSSASRNLKSVSLRSSGDTVDNTVSLNKVRMYCRDSYDNIIAGSTKYLTSEGDYTFISSSSNIVNVTINVPKSAMPQTGKYYLSYSYSSDVAYEYSTIVLLAHKISANAAPGSQDIVNLGPDIKNNAGGFRRSEVLIDLANVNVIEIIAQLKNPSDAVGGQFHMRFKITNESGGEELGYSLDQSESSQITANNTSELVNSQNETNGLLEDIIQHISDQLAAMWDQIYNLMAVPWIQNDNQRTNNTITAIEDSSESTNTTIEQQSSWHANFIIDGLKGLFIPDDDYFESVRTDLSSWFEEHFGFLAQSIDFFIRILNVFITPQSSAIIRFPGISVPNRLTGETYVILAPRNVNLETEINRIGYLNWSEIFPDYSTVPGWGSQLSLCGLCRLVTSVILSFALIQMFIDKLHKIEGM